MNKKKSCRFFTGSLAAAMTIPLLTAISYADESVISISEREFTNGNARLTLGTFNDQDLGSLKRGDTITFTLESLETNRGIALSTIDVKCKKTGDDDYKDFPLNFYYRDTNCYASYRITRSDIESSPGDWDFYLANADVINMTEYKAKAVVEDDEDVKKVLKGVSIKNGGKVKQGDEVRIRPRVASGLYAENFDYNVKYKGESVDCKFEDGYIVFTAPTIIPSGSEPDRDKDEYEFEVSAWEKSENSVYVYLDSTANNIVEDFSWDPHSGLRGTEITITAEVIEAIGYDYQLLVKTNDFYGETIGTLTRKSDSANRLIYQCTFPLPSATVDQYGYEDYNFNIAYSYKYDEDFDLDSLPTVNDKAVNWEDLGSAIKDSTEKVTELDLGNNITIPASAVAAITNVTSTSDKSVEIKASKNVKLLVDSESAKGIDSTKAITFDQQSVTVKPAVEDNLRGTAAISFKAENVNGVKAQFTLTNAKDGEFANLYRINPDSNKAEFVTTAIINGGKVTEKLAGNGQYIVMTGAYSDLKGDADNDGILNVKDAVAILKQSAKVTDAPNNAISILDLNSDGTINVMDAVYILKYTAGVKV